MILFKVRIPPALAGGGGQNMYTSEDEIDEDRYEIDLEELMGTEYISTRDSKLRLYPKDEVDTERLEEEFETDSFKVRLGMQTNCDGLEEFVEDNLIGEIEHGYDVTHIGLVLTLLHDVGICGYKVDLYYTTECVFPLIFKFTDEQNEDGPNYMVYAERKEE